MNGIGWYWYDYGWYVFKEFERIRKLMVLILCYNVFLLILVDEKYFYINWI